MDFKLETLDRDHVVGVSSEDMAGLRAHADYCAERRATGEVGSKDMKLAASVPGIFIVKYCNDHGITFAEFMRDPKHADRLLADPALAHFRVWTGAL